MLKKPLEAGKKKGQIFVEKLLKFSKFYILLFVLVSSIAIGQDGFQWDEAAAMRLPRWGHAAAVYDGKIYVFGGMSHNNRLTNSVEIYDPEEDRWENGPEMLLPLHYHNAVTVEDTIFIIGGRTERGMVSEHIFKFLPNNRRQPYQRFNPLPKPRWGTASVGTDQWIMVVGGREIHNGSRAMADGFLYVFGRNRWIHLESDMEAGRSNFGLVNNDAVFAIGGVDAGFVEPVEVFRDNNWRAIGRFRNARGHLGAAFLGDTLITAGVISMRRSPIADVDGYLPRHNRWVRIFPMSIPRSDLAVVSLDHKIYAIGGIHSISPRLIIENSVEVYSYVTSIDEDNQFTTPKDLNLTWAFPNPSNGSINIKLPYQALYLRIVDLKGAAMRNHTLPKGIGYFSLDGMDLTAGTYIYEILSSKEELLGSNRIVIVK